MAIEYVVFCARHRALFGEDRELDLETPGTRDGIFDVVFPVGRSRDVPLCSECAAPFWEIRDKRLGEYDSGGTMSGADRLPYYNEDPSE